MTITYDKDGNPIDGGTAARLLSHPTYRIVGKTQITSRSQPSILYQVSTVWLGIDHSGGRGKPLIFETMVFGRSARDLDCRRYSTLREAERGHADVVTIVAATVPDEIVK